MTKSQHSVPDDITPQIVLATLATKAELDFNGNPLTDETSSYDRHKLTFISTMRKTQRLAHWMTKNLERRANINPCAPYGIETIKMAAKADLGFYVSSSMVIAACRALNVPVSLEDELGPTFGFTSGSIRNLAKQYSRNQKGNRQYESATKIKAS